MDEIGVFVLSLIRSAPYEYYQLGIDDSVEKRANYVKYFLRQVQTYAFKRRNIYGSGMLGLVDYVPRRAIVKAGEALTAGPSVPDDSPADHQAFRRLLPSTF